MFKLTVGKKALIKLLSTGMYGPQNMCLHVFNMFKCNKCVFSCCFIHYV